MGGVDRKPFQGITNIIRFNWHYYALGIGLMFILILCRGFFSPELNIVVSVIILLTTVGFILSLVVSYYIYDYSDIYRLHWLNSLTINPGSRLVNIHAGFDETSALLTTKYNHSELAVYDFYNPSLHTEASLERARKAYPAYYGTIKVSTSAIPLEPSTIDCVFLIFSAHEIRNMDERILFFKQLQRALKPNGRIVVTEHLRDAANFMAYTIGYFHFFSKTNWLRVFKEGGLTLEQETKITPFISTFILKK